MSLSDTSQRIALAQSPYAGTELEPTEDLARLFACLARTERMFADRVKECFGERGQEVVSSSQRVADIAVQQASKLRAERAQR